MTIYDKHSLVEMVLYILKQTKGTDIYLEMDESDGIIIY